MKIALTIPAYSPHGGIRIIMEWANRLCDYGHSITLLCRRETYHPLSWFDLDRRVKTTSHEKDIQGSDILIICSPHDIELQEKTFAPKRIFLFCQMLEHMFSQSPQWQKKCQKFYGSHHPMFCISLWNIDWLMANYKDRGRLFYTGNGVNTNHFPIEDCYKEGVVLIEGWNTKNPCKDPEGITAMVAKKLKKDGYKIVGYSGKRDIGSLELDEFHFQPSLKTLNRLYRESTILLKATRYDARACAPVEAMTKGCVTARGIVKGDDDLGHKDNCLKVPYEYGAVYSAAVRLLEDKNLRNELAENGRKHVEIFHWDFYMERIESILTGKC